MAVAPAGKVFLAWLGSTAVVATVIRTILINVAIGALTKATSRRPTAFVPPINVTVRNTIENRRLVFGKTRCGGTIVFIYSSGTNREYLHYIVVYTGHQVNAIKTIWIDKIPVLESQITAGAVTAGDFAGKMWITKYLGTSAQTVDSTLSADVTLWTSTHRLQGCAYAHIKMLRDESVYKSGAPADVTAEIEGVKCYDPRLDSTNGGSGSHRMGDPSTWAFTRNPILHARWFITGGSVINDLTSRLIRYGIRDDDVRLIDSFVATAASKCEEQLTGANTTPDGDQQRYTCDLEVSTGETRRDILAAILECCAGSAIIAQGKWRLFAGQYDSPVHTLTDTDLYGDTPIEVEDSNSHTDRYNAVSAVFRDAESSYPQMTTPIRTNSSYETQDGGERIFKEIDLRGITNKYRAQRLCEIHLRKSRLMRTIKIRGALNLLKIAPYETFTLSHTRLNWSSKVFRCIEREFEFGEDAGRVVITAQEESSTIYTDLATASYLTPNTATQITLTETPFAPTNLTTAGLQNGILIKWDRSATIGTTYELEQSTSSAMTSPTKIYDGPDNQATLDKTGTTIYYFRVRAKKNGTYSAYLPSTGGVSGAALTIFAGLNATASPSSASSSSTSASQTTPSVTVTASGGTSPYTYAWTWISGGTGITIDTATAATTTFTATGLGNPETRSGIARCTVTDNVSATKTVDVSVSIERLASFAATAAGTAPLSKTANASNITSNNITATPSGGTPGYTYAWSIVTHDDPNSTPVINNSTSQTCTVTTNENPANQRTINVTVRCVVTDSAAKTATTNTVTISHTHDNGV